MKVSPASRATLTAVASRALPLLALALAATVVLAPHGIGFSTGITKDNAPDAAAFAEQGCTACHGVLHEFVPLDTSNVRWSVTDAEGEPLNGPYVADTSYTITITLNETNSPGSGNHAGFNLRTSAGTLEAVADESKVSGDGTEATHVDADRTSWSVTWVAPAEGPAVFDLFVNDVDGSGAPDTGDEVYRVGFYFTDHDGALPGAQAEEPHFGITLQQYWIGLIGLAGMVLIIIASLVYLKFANPHNTDAKDR